MFLSFFFSIEKSQGITVPYLRFLPFSLCRYFTGDNYSFVLNHIWWRLVHSSQCDEYISLSYRSVALTSGWPYTRSHHCQILIIVWICFHYGYICMVQIVSLIMKHCIKYVFPKSLLSEKMTVHYCNWIADNANLNAEHSNRFQVKRLKN